MGKHTTLGHGLSGIEQNTRNFSRYQIPHLSFLLCPLERTATPATAGGVFVVVGVVRQGGGAGGRYRGGMVLGQYRCLPKGQ